MTEEKKINDPMERAIIKSFDLSDTGILKRETIIKSAKISIEANEGAIAKRIEELTKNEYLIHTSRGHYKKNPDYSFKFIDEPCSVVANKSKNVLKEEIREHTLNLKDAIRTWIYDFSEPCKEYPLDGGKLSSDIIHACESHVLFPDLTNHLPNMCSTVCSDWESYKKELEELDDLKGTLLRALGGEIRNCFEGLKFIFPYNDQYNLPEIVYNIVVGLQAGQEGYDSYENALYWLRNTHIQEQSDHIFWGEYLTVPAKNRDLLEKGVSEFITFFENAVDGEFNDLGRDIVIKVDSLKRKRDKIIRELDRLLKYTSFPGECEYLR